MLTIVFFVVLAVVFFGLGVWLDCDHEFCAGVCFVAGVVSLIIAICMIWTAVENLIGLDGKIARCQQRYDSLTYQLENNLYDNDNDLGKKELYDQIQDWNEDLAEGKALQRDIWVGAFYPNIYDEFDFIELE